MAFELAAQIVLKSLKLFAFVAILYGSVMVLKELRSHCLYFDSLLLSSGDYLGLQRLRETRTPMTLSLGNLEVSGLWVIDCELRE